ncbi:MAG: carboxypeptidase regulatory-like domain-containing protein [Planctomycetia bacterium]
MRTSSSLRRIAPVVLLSLVACGRGEMPIDPEGVARYGAFRYEEGATVNMTGGGSASAISTAAVVLPPAGGAAAPQPGVAEPEPQGGAGPRGKKGAKYEVIEVTDGGTIKITCKVSSMPDQAEIPFNKDKEGCGHPGMKNERAVVDPATMGLANCVVYLVDIAKGKDFEGEMAEKGRTVLLDQHGCQYVPHVSLVRTGSSISVKNSDPVQHNVKAFLNNRATLQFNLMSSSNSLLDPTDETKLGKAGNYLLFCDIHFWMTGYIRAVAHPYHAVTGADGVATLTKVPAGTYKVGCWHEGMVLKVVQAGAEVTGYEPSADFEEEAQDVNVTAGGTSEVTFSINPR